MTITVEDLLDGLTSLVQKGAIRDQWHRNFMSSVQTYVCAGNALSTNQAQIILKVSTNHIAELCRELRSTRTTIESAIKVPVYKKSPYQSISIKREVRYIGMDKLAFRFKLDTLVVSELKALRSSGDPVNSAPRFNHKYRLWIVSVTPGNLEKVFDIIKRHKFEFDERVLEYMTLCTNSKKAVSTFATVEDGLAVANVTNNPLLSYVVKNLMGGNPI
jgi:hypothetical protein